LRRFISGYRASSEPKCWGINVENYSCTYLSAHLLFTYKVEIVFVELLVLLPLAVLAFLPGCGLNIRDDGIVVVPIFYDEVLADL
jgi:hypothetical protein